MNDVFLLLGSNLGDRQSLLEDAIIRIAVDIAPITRASSVYETASWGIADQPDYLNQVVVVNTDISARQVLEKILTIEKNMGRLRAEKWGSRVIDIDILFYGNAIIGEPDLTIPHPELHNRRFTLEPLAEIAPKLTHPVLNKEILQLKNELKDKLIVKKLYF